ncbi:hypothetical protein I3760_02G042000 [Carya illinoinensis]|nr:hypothetical protein I3760_02G042000 [Carya illinoinensis]
MASHDSLLSFASLPSILIAINIVLCSFCLSTSAALNNGGFSVDPSTTIPLMYSPFYNSSETPSQRTAAPFHQPFLFVGTPPVPVLRIADTASDLIWLQCKPCTDFAYIQYLMVINHSHGDLAFDTLTLGSSSSSASGFQPASFSNIIIGCGHDNGGTFSVDGFGIIGLGGGMVSLVSQLSSSVDDSTRTSRMSFGSDAIVSGPEVVSTPLAMSVGNKRLELGYSSPFIEGNIIIDSGTTLTLLPADFYKEFESAVAEEIDAERTRDPGNVPSLCYKSASDNIGAPIITAHFRGADVQLNQLNTFLRLGEELLCLAFRPDESVYIFGNLAQTSFLVGYDLKEKTVSFMPADCNRMHM